MQSPTTKDKNTHKHSFPRSMVFQDLTIMMFLFLAYPAKISLADLWGLLRSGVPKVLLDSSQNTERLQQGFISSICTAPF